MCVNCNKTNLFGVDAVNDNCRKLFYFVFLFSFILVTMCGRPKTDSWRNYMFFFRYQLRSFIFSIGTL